MWDRLEQREIARRGLRPGPAARPRPDLAAWDDLIPQIKHIVVLMMENHSYDNYLGMMKGRGDGLPLGADGTPDVVNTVPDGRQFTRPPPDVHHAASGEPHAELARQPHRLRRRQLRRVLGQRGRDRPRRRSRRPPGLLDRERTALLLRARAHVPGRRPVVLLLHGADVPEPPLPHRRHRERADRRPAVGPRGLPRGRDHLRRADQPRHLLGELPQREAGDRGSQAPARHRAAWSALRRLAQLGRWLPRVANAVRGQQVVHRRPVSARARPVRAAPAYHAAVLRRRGRGHAARGVDRGPRLRRVLGGEPAGHRLRRVIRRGGDQRVHERPGVGIDAAAVDLRRARRVLRPRPAARRRSPRTTCRRATGSCRCRRGCAPRCGSLLAKPLADAGERGRGARRPTTATGSGFPR